MLRRTPTVFTSSVVHETFSKAHRITLNREKALNSLNVEMVELMEPIYRGFEKSGPNDFVVILKGAGSKAFCAGGDVVSIVKDEPKGTQKSFFYREYQVDYAIMTLQQPHVSLLDGIVMGGGVGVSVHGSHRVASEKALFAMPETAIGLFPDVGGSWFLPRLPKNGLGAYLALTGQRLKGADLVHAGVGTHFVTSESMPKLEEALVNIENPAAVDDVIGSFTSPLPTFSLESQLAQIEKHFGNFPESVEGIVDSLKSEGSEWANKTVGILNKCSPTSLKVSLELHNRGGKMNNAADVFAMEYNATQQIMAEHDFHAGVTALLIDKQKNFSAWKPATLAEVTPEQVAAHVTAGPGVAPWIPSGPYPANKL